MRSHGVPNYPDPKMSANGEEASASINSGSGINPNSPAFGAAQQACRKYTPPPPSPAQHASHEAQLLKFAECMRAHGVPNFPDPTSTGLNIGPNSGIDAQSPAVKAAVAACGGRIP